MISTQSKYIGLFGKVFKKNFLFCVLKSIFEKVLFVGVTSGSAVYGATSENSFGYLKVFLKKQKT